MDGRWMWAFAALGAGVAVVAVGARVGGVGVGSASAARVRSCLARAARRRVPPTGHRRGVRHRVRRRPPTARTPCGRCRADGVRTRCGSPRLSGAPRTRAAPSAARRATCRGRGDEGNRTPNPRLAKSTEGWFGTVGCDWRPYLTSTFADGRSRLSLADFGHSADHLRTVCGLGPPQPSPRTLP